MASGRAYPDIRRHAPAGAGVARAALDRFRGRLTHARRGNDEVLRFVLGLNADTEFGRRHGFRAILAAADIASEFRQRVPLMEYPDLAPYVDRIQAGAQSVLTTDPVHMLAGTSGTTDRPKRIPRTRRAQRQSMDLISLVQCAVIEAGIPGASAPGRGINLMSLAAVPAPDTGTVPVMAGPNAGMASIRTRRVILKTRLVVQPRRLHGATLRHGRHLEREPAGEPGHLTAYGPETDTADIDALADRCADDRHQFRFIVSAEDGVALDDLRLYTRTLMQQVERDLQTRLDWVAVDHRDTDNPHSHVLWRGRAADGRDLVTPLDRILQREAVNGVIDLRQTPATPSARQVHARKLGRLAHLAKLGLAEESRPGRGQLARNAGAMLKDLGEWEDMIRHVPNGRPGTEVYPWPAARDHDGRAGTGDWEVGDFGVRPGRFVPPYSSGV